MQIDAAALGAAVANGLRQAGFSQEQRASQPVSQFQAAIAQLRSGDSDPEALNVIETLFNGFKSDLSAEQRTEIGKAISSERIRAANTTLLSEIERAVEANEDLERYAKAVEKLVGDEFTNDPAHEAERQKLFRDGVDQRFIRKLVNKHFTALAGDKKKGGALSGMTSTEGASQAAAAQAGKTQAGNVGELNEAQRSLYYSIVQEQERIGFKQLGKTKEQVEADAFTRASAKFR